MSDKLLSIIVPSYNMEAYLPKCLGSMVVDDAELLSRLEVMVVNDGSTDRTGEIAHEFADKHPDVFRVIDKSNGHYGSCVNAALKLIIGRYVKIVDADDSVDSAGLCVLLRALAEEADRGESAADLIVADFVEVDLSGAVTRHSDFGLREAGYYTLADMPASGEYLTMHALAYRADLLREMDYRQTEGIPYSDTDWYVRPLAQVKQLRYLDVAVNRYLIGRPGQSVDQTVFIRDFAAFEKIVYGLVADYARHAATAVPASREYWTRRILEKIEQLYLTNFFGCHNRFPSTDLVAFDAYLLKTSPELHEAAGRIPLGRRHFRVYPIREWRRNHRLHTLNFLIYRIFRRLAVFYVRHFA